MAGAFDFFLVPGVDKDYYHIFTLLIKVIKLYFVVYSQPIPQTNFLGSSPSFFKKWHAAN